ncbi:helix-turn-helix domain-containing protein [Lactobacillus sp. ESL0680]|uniref:helix-turn-helix domain-containing protein n=1 Tax=Lactobacillus sp. ESL0680 TaxID=2983210 RepID=UPI0023F89588|nr:Rgg/GadR/MutR family transcriptional regulator [Lactobacillus sp. ESL0680]WEV39156.1 helix-turn-helix domain-containing protein [Lactobacillus sp. ESL0680]
MNTFGETIRQLRLSRSISQEELAEGLFDRSTLSKIESDKVYPSRENANEMISRLSLGLNEFEYVQRDYLPTKKNKILYKLLNLEFSTEIDKIKKIIADCSASNDSDLKRISLVLKAFLLLNEKDGLEPAKKLVQPIWNDYLSKIKILTITDICLLNMIAYAFDYETNKQIISKILYTIDNYYPFLKILKLNVLINLSNLHIDKENYQKAKDTLTQADKLAQEVGQYDKSLLCHSEIALCGQDYEQALYYADLLDKIGATTVAQPLKDEINNKQKLHN